MPSWKKPSGGVISTGIYTTSIARSSGPISTLLVPEKGDQDPANSQQLGRSRGGFSTKLHMRVDGKGRPLTYHLAPGQSHDQ